MLVGDPGLADHNVGNLYNLVAQTQMNSLQTQGHNVVVCRVSSIQHIVTQNTRVYPPPAIFRYVPQPEANKMNTHKIEGSKYFRFRSYKNVGRGDQDNPKRTVKQSQTWARFQTALRLQCVVHRPRWQPRPKCQFGAGIPIRDIVSHAANTKGTLYCDEQLRAVGP